MATHRLFFALWPEQDLQQQFFQLSASLVLEKQGKRVPAAQLHVTLAFLGDVADDQMAAVIALGDALRLPPMVLTLDHLGYWKKPQVLWLGCHAPCEALKQSVSHLQQGLSQLGIAIEERCYTPHLTLLRKVVQRPTVPKIEPYYWQVNGFCLVESRLSAAGASYQLIKRWA